ncbi:MAG TPA: PHP domain-containing protein [Methanoregulaceae archaeon]|nr:PHP domain-containing protein [Methanoregulaceae archaeon]HPS22481.1 PHP domain-containing protein [Methanoregulaceae archaeon]HQN89638.1 PHP domain-containing protein [Methanoregulaceae archaeon]HQP81872.1 PHP domain-containing protein [Methanoregulaceae archaeon]
MLSCDLHVHTIFSRDGESTPLEIIRRAEAVGLDAIAITDHDTVEGAIAALSIPTSLVIIPGIEISTRQGHLIALGVTEKIPAGLDVIETIHLAKERGAVLILPHPYHVWRHGVGRKLRSALYTVDAIEVFNSRYIVGSANLKAARMARRICKPCVGGSDAHHARYVGFGRTTIDAKKDCGSILAAIREGKTSAAGKMTPLPSYTRQTIRNTWKKFRRRISHR